MVSLKSLFSLKAVFERGPYTERDGATGIVTREAWWKDGKRIPAPQNTRSRSPLLSMTIF